MFNKKRLLDNFLKLVRIDSPTFAEREVGDFLLTYLQELGCEVYEDNTGEKIGGNCGNIIATLKATKAAPSLLLNAHMDCVQPCLGVKPQLKDGIITSDGTTVLGSDNKAGVAAIMEALHCLKEQNLSHGEIKIVFCVAEESGLLGSKNIDPQAVRADFGYVLDSSDSPGRIVCQAPGQDKINVKIHGKAAHAGIEPEAGVNAITAAAKIISKLPQGRIDEQTTCNVGTINGGIATNIVADFVEINAETRSLDENKLAALTEQFRSTFQNGAEQEQTKADIQIENCYTAFTLDKTAEVIQTAEKAARALGLTVNINATGGGSDANCFNVFGIPCAVLGIGMQQVHTTKEFIKEEDLYNTAALLLQIIQNI